MPAPSHPTTLLLAVGMTVGYPLFAEITVVTKTNLGWGKTASHIARTKIEDTHDENIRAFPTLKLQQETSMAETSYTSSKIIIYYQNV